ncbi:tyrosine-protein phosphatase non-receptor type 23 [Paragonimus westermani]|uniref:Tyrosine-protein phosphatase non-receptor type 23 n=1 Tax=Paragonimus westermani TaxID=34504 RepID=A0A5J4P1R1_9TREM|nr:tyrosine-protein phosphatase non-receptor type 23 [Paragonimus westermani]
MAAPSLPAGPNASTFGVQIRPSPPSQIGSSGPTTSSHCNFRQQIGPTQSSLSLQQSYQTGTQMPQPSVFSVCSSLQSNFGSTTVIPQSAGYPAHPFALRPPVIFSNRSPHANFHPSVRPVEPSGHISIPPAVGQPRQHQQLISAHPGPLGNYQVTQVRHPVPAETTRPVPNSIFTGLTDPVPLPQQHGQPSQQLVSSAGSNVDWRPPNIVRNTQPQIGSFTSYQPFQPLPSTDSAIQPVLAVNPTQHAKSATHESSSQAHVLQTNSNHVQPPLSATAPVTTDFIPLKPHVLTKAELDAQRREERLRATYGSQPSTDSTAINLPDSAGNLKGAGSVTASSGPTITTNPVISPSSNSTTMPHPQPVSTAELNRDAGRAVDVPVKSEPEPLSDPLVLNRFIAATENLLTWLENLNEPFPGASAHFSNKPAPTKLDAAWTRVLNLATDYQNAPLFKGKKPTQATALCCSSKNRHQDFVPFDANRVVLDSAKNDYINASHIDFLGTVGDWCPRYIMAQAPMQKTVVDFWNMIISQGCEVVVLFLPSKHSRPGSPLASFSNANPGEGGYGDPSDPHHIPVHLPLNKVGARFNIPGSSLEIRLQAIKESTQNDGSGGLRTNGSMLSDSGKSDSWTERILTIHNLETQQTRSLVHLCYHGSILQAGSNTSIEHGAEHLCAFINHVHTYYKQQRSLVRPIAVICEHGAGSCGIFVTASVGLLHAERLGRVADVVDIAGYLCQQRRGALNNPSQLVMAARIIAHAAVETVARRDVVVGPRRYLSSASEHNVSSSKAGTVMVPVSEASPSASLIDTLFSGRTVQLNELMSVVDKWTVGGNSVAPEHSPGNHGDSTKSCLVQQEKVAEDDTAVCHPCEFNLDGLLVSDCDSSGVRTSGTPVDVTYQQQQKQLPPIDHLVELSSLTVGDSPPRPKRYTRHEFQSVVTTRPVSTTEDLFAQLDPLVVSKQQQ